jgi:hypothetical protein
MNCAFSGCKRDASGRTRYCLQHLVSKAIENAHLSDQFPQFAKGFADTLMELPVDERELLELRWGLRGRSYSLAKCVRILNTPLITLRQREASALRRLQRPGLIRALERAVEIYLFKPSDPAFQEVNRRHHRALLLDLARHPEKIHELDDADFEHIVAEMYHADGYDVHVTRRTRDGGKDIVAQRRDRFGTTTKVVIQCKRYARNKPVSAESVRDLYGVKLREAAHHAILVTTSYFTKDAMAYSMDRNVFDLHLMDVYDVRKWISEYTRGVKADANALGQTAEGPPVPTKA